MGTALALEHLSAREPDSGLVRVVVDTPKGSRNKYTYDETLGLYRLSKVLPLGIAFPYDFGFIPSTRAEDGDPLDVLLLGEEALFPGCLVTVRLVGVIQAEQTEPGKTFRNDRLLGAIETSVNRPAIQTLADLQPERLDEIEYFFMAYNHLEGRHFKPLGRHGPARASFLPTEYGSAVLSRAAALRSSTPQRTTPGDEAGAAPVAAHEGFLLRKGHTWPSHSVIRKQAPKKCSVCCAII